MSYFISSYTKKDLLDFQDQLAVFVFSWVRVCCLLFGGVPGEPPVFCFIFPVGFQLSLSCWWGCWSTEWMSSDQGAVNQTAVVSWGELAVCCRDPRWWFQILYFLFSPLFGEIIQFNEHIFQMGWIKRPTRTMFTPFGRQKNETCQFFKP